MTSQLSNIFRTSLLTFSLFILFFLFSCASTDQDIPNDLNAVTYFQEAQTIAADQGDYALAIRYYQAFIERYPEDLQRIVIAKYEIAFLNYKRGKLDLARQQFEELLSYYENEGLTVLPKWPKILAEKVLKEKLR